MDNTLNSVVVSVSDPTELRSLREWLQQEPGIEIRQISGVPTPGDLQSRDALQVSAARGRLVVAASAIAAFVRARRARVSVTVRTNDTTITVTAANVEDVSRILRRALALTGVDDERHENRLPTLDHGLFDVEPPVVEPSRGGEVGSFRQSNVDASDIPVSIYLANGAAHEDVEIAVGQALAAADLQITERGEPITGSWWRAFRAKRTSPVGREVMAVAAHAAEQHVVLDKDADITARLMENLGSVITALQPEQNAVVRLGAALIVKANGVLVVHQLTAVQQLKLNHHPRLLQSPCDILVALEAMSDDDGSLPAIER